MQVECMPQLVKRSNILIGRQQQPEPPMKVRQCRKHRTGRTRRRDLLCEWNALLFHHI